MKLLITGALGHIGSRFTHTLERNTFDEVYLLDDLSTQRYPSLLTLPRNLNFSFLEQDITSGNLEPLLENVDVVIHLAAIAHANRSNKDPFSTFDHSLRTLENVLDANRHRNSHLIYFSSSMVYGNFGDKVATEVVVVVWVVVVAVVVVR